MHFLSPSPSPLSLLLLKSPLTSLGISPKVQDPRSAKSFAVLCISSPRTKSGIREHRAPDFNFPALHFPLVHFACPYYIYVFTREIQDDSAVSLLELLPRYIPSVSSAPHSVRRSTSEGDDWGRPFEVTFSAAVFMAIRLTGTSSFIRHSKAITGTGPLGFTNTE
jgi:hypothetical protein